MVGLWVDVTSRHREVQDWEDSQAYIRLRSSIRLTSYVILRSIIQLRSSTCNAMRGIYLYIIVLFAVELIFLQLRRRSKIIQLPDHTVHAFPHV